MIKKLLLSSAFLAFGWSIQAQTTIFNENFDNETSRNSWILEDRDGDGEFWEFADANFEEIDSFQGWFAWSWSWYFEVFTPDNTLISPNIILPAEGTLNLSFKIAAFDDEEVFQEHYAVYVIPATASFSGTETPVFEETLDGAYYYDPKMINVDISAFAGQEVKLVFRHYDCENIFYIGLDDIQITHEENSSTGSFDAKSINVYPNPTSDILFIQGSDNVQKIRVFDLKGRLIKEVFNTSEINLQNISNGTYIINFYTDTNVYSRKITKK